MRGGRLAGVALALLAGSAGAENGPTRYSDPATGLPAWEWRGDGIHLQHIQRLPDQTRAFFMGRGFSAEDAERVAGTCVFQNVFYNHSGETLHLDLAEWRFVVEGTPARGLKLTADWQAEWEARDSPESARIAFQWSLFPNVQEFAPGDWNMGMVTYPVPPGTRMDVRISWRSGEQSHQALLPGVVCAEDKTLSPAGESQ